MAILVSARWFDATKQGFIGGFADLAVANFVKNVNEWEVTFLTKDRCKHVDVGYA